MLDWTGQGMKRGRQYRVLVLGVTPEIVQLPWPEQGEIFAVDSSLGMIEIAWQPHPSLPSAVACARWQEMPIKDRAFDVVVGDGSLNALPGFDYYGEVLREVARVLKPAGALILRCFVRPDVIETPEQVFAAAMAGQFSTTAAFRLRFSFALTQADGSLGLADLFNAFESFVPDRSELARVTGWPREHIDFADAHKKSKIGLTFPTMSKLTALSEEWFAIDGMRRGTYTQSGDCPTILFKPL